MQQQLQKKKKSWKSQIPPMSLPSISYVVSVDTSKSLAVSRSVVPVKLMAESYPLVLNLVTPVVMIRATLRQQKQH